MLKPDYFRTKLYDALQDAGAGQEVLEAITSDRSVAKRAAELLRLAATRKEYLHTLLAPLPIEQLDMTESLTRLFLGHGFRFAINLYESQAYIAARFRFTPEDQHCFEETIWRFRLMVVW